MTDVSLLAALAGGLISFLSPCVLPLVPPYMSYLAGVSVEEIQREDDWAVRRRALLTAVVFVLGFTTVFTALGATASFFGQLVRQYMDVFGYLAGAVIIVMGLHFLGVFRIALLYREARFQGGSSAGLGGAYVMGLAFASAGRRASGRSSPRSWRWRAPRRASGAAPSCSPSIPPGSASPSSSPPSR